ncbi:glucose-6-phosphate isomerase [Aquicella lusitana]|uniref:Glucose-6-phosphate isomerase n=1 Tax=Aquicella lusitana TaxID=254246 RepID=A0A370GS50_9COXI|nr:glucose-6-phosphate isomerase [Aquicella lusitana]RDI46528.1 glucose-6-phosphate isomerase [Aquicella lusitana]VVC74192.1 Glucose-6-phosphate isomerase [Aquicella lusitana]
MKNLTELPEWQALFAHHQEVANLHLRALFAEDRSRFARFSLESGELFLDYSRNRISSETIKLLTELAEAVQLRQKIEALFNGQPINHTEKRPALHTALRDKRHTPIQVNGENIASIIAHMQQQLHDFVDNIHSKTWKGVTGKPIKHIVNLGIGGSHHGPQMAIHALKDFAVSDLQFHFISSVDKAHLNDVLEQIDPETSLFILSSKSFTTIETLTNARTILAWLRDKFGENVLKHHFVAVTAAPEKAIAFGIPKENIFPLWDWVGGRYSIWSAIGLPIALMLGNKHFEDFLAGAYEMDQHFRQADFSKNMPVLLALLTVWYLNFFGARAQAIVPYAHRLRYLVPYLQQAEMESNGKCIRSDSSHILYATGPVIFGEEGCNGQHTYHQLLHQGQHLIPVDFILIGKMSPSANDHHHETLIASGLSQAQALMRGKTFDEAYQELIARHCSPDEAKQLAHHQMIPGNKPSNVLVMEQLTPRNLGALLALYEHKIFVQGIIWDINPFDQWGVELGKQLLPQIIHRLKHMHTEDETDCATEGLIHHYKKIQDRL